MHDRYTPWIGCKPVSGKTNTHADTHTHTTDIKFNIANPPTGHKKKLRSSVQTVSKAQA